MNITERQVNGVTVFELDGRVDTDGAIQLEDTLNNAVNAGKNKLVLDMGAVRYMNSAGLRILADVLTQTRENGGNTHLVSVPKKVMRVFEIVGFAQFFQIFDDVAGATQSF